MNYADANRVFKRKGTIITDKKVFGSMAELKNTYRTGKALRAALKDAKSDVPRKPVVVKPAEEAAKEVQS